MRSAPPLHSGGEAQERVLVLDGQTNQALACVRSLGRAGHAVFVASHLRWPLATWSRYCRDRFRLESETIEAFAELRAWARERGVTLVLPLTERACLLCNAERPAWESLGIVVGCGPDEMLLRAFDKAQTVEHAAACGVPTPPTRAPTSLVECREAAEAVGYPCVVKPRFSNFHDGFVFRAGGAASYVGDPTQFDAAIAASRQGDRWPVIQGYVPGSGKGVFALCDHGRAVAWFAHERLRDVRPSGSGSSLRRAIALDPRLREPAERLLCEMQWHGPAMVEFRDDGTHPPYLIEVNGRFWGSLQLAVSAGVDFPSLWVALLRGRTITPFPAYTEGVTLRWLWGDVKRFLYIMAGAPAGYPGRYPSARQGLRELLGPQPPGTRSETWSAGDRWPAVGELVQGVGEVVTRALRRRASPAPAPLDGDGRRPVRVLMVTSDWPTPDRPRTTNFIKRQAEFLQAAGADVDVLHFPGAQKPLNYLAAWRAVRRRLAAGRYDLVHAQFGQSGLVALPKRVPLVVTFRGSDLLGVVSDATGRQSWRGRVLQRLSRMVARRADAVIVVSEHMKAQLPAGVAATVIPSGLDLQLFHPIPRDEARRRLGWAPDRRVVLFVGRPFQARKRHALARDAVALLNRVQPTDLVVAWGVPHVEMPVYMSAADVLVCTSMQEGSPNVVKEALACNLPVVSVAVGDVALRLKGVDGCELCADDRPETIAAALDRVLRRGQRVDGHDAVQPLNEALLTEQVLSIYRSVLNGRAADRRGTRRLTVRELAPSEELQWDALVRRFDNHRIVHTRAWLRSLEASGCGRPLYLVCERDHEIVGCLPGLLVRLGPLRLFGSPLPGWQTVSMGPVFDERRVTTTELVGACMAFLRHRYGIHHIELMTNHLDPVAMPTLGFRGEAVATYRAPLHPGDEATTLRAMKDSARRNVRRAIKLGLVTRFETDESFVDEHYSQIKEVYARRGFSVPFGKRRVLEYFRHMKAAGSLLAIAVYLGDGGPCIATGMFTVDGHELLLSMWTHRTSYRWYRPTELMTWTVMQRAIALGCNSFDLMGRGDFKAKFGAEPDWSKRRWVWSRYRWLTWARDLVKRAHLWQQVLRGHVTQLRTPLLPPSPTEAGQVEDRADRRSRALDEVAR